MRREEVVAANLKVLMHAAEAAGGDFANVTGEYVVVVAGVPEEGELGDVGDVVQEGAAEHALAVPKGLAEEERMAAARVKGRGSKDGVGALQELGAYTVDTAGSWDDLLREWAAVDVIVHEPEEEQQRVVCGDSAGRAYQREFDDIDSLLAVAVATPEDKMHTEEADTMYEMRGHHEMHPCLFALDESVWVDWESVETPHCANCQY
jgi:hypothetical protein